MNILKMIPLSDEENRALEIAAFAVNMTAEQLAQGILGNALDMMFENDSWLQSGGIAAAASHVSDSETRH